MHSQWQHGGCSAQSMKKMTWHMTVLSLDTVLPHYFVLPFSVCTISAPKSLYQLRLQGWLRLHDLFHYFCVSIMLSLNTVYFVMTFSTHAFFPHSFPSGQSLPSGAVRTRSWRCPGAGNWWPVGRPLQPGSSWSGHLFLGQLRPGRPAQARLICHTAEADSPERPLNHVLLIGNDNYLIVNTQILELMFSWCRGKVLWLLFKSSFSRFPPIWMMRYAYLLFDLLFYTVRYTMAAQDLIMRARGVLKDRGWRISNDRLGSGDDISVYIIPLMYGNKQS